MTDDFDDVAKHRMRDIQISRRRQCRRDLWYLGKEVLGYRKLTHHLHADMMRWEIATRDQTDIRACLIPRGMYKSTLYIIVAIQRMLRTHGLDDHPDHPRRLRTEEDGAYFSWSQENAATFVGEIKEHFEINDQLRALFPEIVWEKPSSEAATWTDSEFVLKRGTYRNHRHSTVSAHSILKLPASFHVDWIHVDDGETKENTGSRDTRRKLKEQYDNLTYLTNGAETQITLIGTLASHDGPHAREIARAADYAKRGWTGRATVPIYHRRAIENGASILPEVWPLERLEREREKNPAQFAMHMMIDPTSQAYDKVDISKLNYYKMADRPKRETFRMVVIVCDPARKQTNRSDYTAIGVFGYMYNGWKWLLDGVYDKCKPEDTIRHLIRLDEKWKPSRPPAMEENGLNAWGISLLDQMGYAGRIGWYESKGVKEDNIQKTLPCVRQGNMWVPSDYPQQRGWDDKPYNLTECYVSELRDFPSAAHDDMLDVSQQADKLAYYRIEADPNAPMDDGLSPYDREFWKSVLKDQRRLVSPTVGYSDDSFVNAA